MTSTATASAPVTPAPRKGDSVLIDGVTYKVERRYCHGLWFDLQGPNGYRALDLETFRAGEAAGTISRVRKG
jgi:hypothetical protein